MSEAQPPIEVFSACLARDLHIFERAVRGLRRHLNVGAIVVAAPRSDFPAFQRRLGSEVELLDERELPLAITLAELRAEPTIGAQAGWYFQQFLKLAFGLMKPEPARYLIWDADTVLLRPIDLFDREGRTLFTIADEHYEPYFETYRRLFSHEPHREFSFIAQHMVIDRAILREMIQRIEETPPDDGPWPWRIVRRLGSFSEYEVYGHYVKNVHPEMAVFRRLPWTRDGSLVSYRPSERALRRLGEKYAFAAFEAKQSPLNRARWYIERLRQGHGPVLPAALRGLFKRKAG